MRILHSLAYKLDAAIGRHRARTPGAIDPHIGFATEKEIILRGRVLAREPRLSETGESGRLGNFRAMIGLFLTKEVSAVPVTCGDAVAVTDEEGYFALTLPRAHDVGWHTAQVSLPDGTETPCPFFVPDPDAPALLISDIDDTVLQTGAWSLFRNLWTTFTGNVETRQIYDDAVAVYAKLNGSARVPVFFVSSSPWNVHGFLLAVFDRTGLPRGPLFLRDFGVDRTKFITAGHGDHKGDAIDLILDAYPGQTAILVGDTGQEDARIYRAAIDRHPGRIAALMLRIPGPRIDKRIERQLSDLRDTGVPLFAGRDFTSFAAELVSLLGLTDQ
jgi:phosphatidate phosphatase APP1